MIISSIDKPVHGSGAAKLLGYLVSPLQEVMGGGGDGRSPCCGRPSSNKED